MLHFLGGGQRADAKFFNTQGPIVVRVKGNAGVIVGVQAQHLLRHQLQRKQQFCPIRQQQIHVGTFELDDDVGVFEIRMTVVSGLDGKVQIELPMGDHLTEKLLDPGTSFINQIARIQALFLPLSLPRLLRSLSSLRQLPLRDCGLVEKPLLGQSDDSCQ